MGAHRCNEPADGGGLVEAGDDSGTIHARRVGGRMAA